MPGLAIASILSTPAPPRLLGLVRDFAARGTVAGRFVDIAEAVEAEVAARKGKRIPLNIDGATAVIYGELGFPPPLTRGLFVLSRSVGILAHAWEQSQQPRAQQGAAAARMDVGLSGHPRAQISRCPTLAVDLGKLMIIDQFPGGNYGWPCPSLFPARFARSIRHGLSITRLGEDRQQHTDYRHLPRLSGERSQRSPRPHESLPRQCEQSKAPLPRSAMCERWHEFNVPIKDASNRGVWGTSALKASHRVKEPSAIARTNVSVAVNNDSNAEAQSPGFHH